MRFDALDRVVAAAGTLVLLAAVLVVLTRDSACPAFAVTVGGRGFNSSGGEGDGRVNIVLTDNHLRTQHVVTHDNTSYGPAISPDGRRLAYESGRGYDVDPETGPRGSRIHVMDLDGGHDRVVSDGYDLDPQWSPDGSKLLFVRRSQPAGLWTVDLSTGRQTEIPGTSGLDANMRPQWLADGPILFESGFEIESILPTGGTPTPLARVPDNRLPVFDLDGSRYAVNPQRHGDPIQVVNVRSGRSTDVPRSATQGGEPLLWTDRGRLVFIQNVRGADINIVSWHPGDESPAVLDRASGIPLDLADNPACAP